MNRPPRVLLPCDTRDWVVNVVDGYQRLGWDVTTGVYNLELEACQPDVVHLNWPEELVGWKRPTQAQVDALKGRLDRWIKHARLIVTVHNLYPHGGHGDTAWRQLYEAVYERAEVIHHLSQTSRDLICAEYPSIVHRNHVVRLGFNYDLLLPNVLQDRAAARRALGLEPDAMVFLSLGAVRFWPEVCLLHEAFARARVTNKRLILGSRFSLTGSGLSRRWRHLQWKMWKRRADVVPSDRYIPDEELPALFAATDAVIIIRQESLSSGLPSLAMTFGRMVIGPTVGAIPEYLAGADNILYEGSSATNLAQALERAVHVDREAIGAQNRRIAAEWKWDRIIKTCLDALPSR
jgi:glycosyltransferase involved in cell wall biosynthesis